MKKKIELQKQHWAKGLTILLGAAFIASTVDASTVSYWRHEEGPQGAVVASGPGAILDASGNGNTQRTFDNTFTAASYTNDVSPKPLRSGLPNTLSLDFTPNYDNYTDDGVELKSHVFDAITVELAFKLDAVGGFYSLVGKDGKPTDALIAPLQIKVRGDTYPNDIANQLQFEYLDGDGDAISLASGFSMEVGAWYHVAAIVNANGAELWIATGTGDYVLVDSAADDMAGDAGEVIYNAPNQNWTVGRGFFNGSIVDWADAKIDEVRISDMALGANEFLFVPEPASAALLVLAGLLAVRRR